MDKAPNHPHTEAEKLERGGTTNSPQPNVLERMRHIARSNIARTALTVSTAVSNILGHTPDIEARPAGSAILAREKAPRKPKINYQKFPNSNARLEIIEGRDLLALESTPEIADKLNPKNRADIAKIGDQCEFYDAWHSGIPLVRIKPGDLEKRVSPHFKVKDFVRIDPKWLHVVKKGTYQKHEGEYYRTIARIDPKLIDLIEQIVRRMERDANKRKKKKDPKVRIELHVDEAYRPYGENARTYQWKNDHRDRKEHPHEEWHPKSRHISGRAVDIDRIPGLEEMADRVLIERGTGGIGKHGLNIVHVDNRPEKYAGWGYNGKLPKLTPAPKAPKKVQEAKPSASILITDTVQAQKQLKRYTRMEQLIADGVVSKGAAQGYFYYGLSDESLWEKKMILIRKTRNKRHASLQKLEQQERQFEKKHPKKKLPAKLAENLEKARSRHKHYVEQLTSAQAARDNALKEKGTDYTETDYRTMIKRALDTWIPKLKKTHFEAYMPYLNNPDLYHALHVQEIIPSRYRVGKKRAKLTPAARVHMYHLLTLYKDPTKMPAVNDSAASFGIGQTTLDTHTGLKKLDAASPLKLPDFEDCTTFDCQMRRDILNAGNNIKRFDENVFEKHPRVKQLFDDASASEQALFLATIIGAMHNGGPNIMRTAEQKLGTRLDDVETLTEAENLLLSHLSKPSARHYGRHVQAIYAELTGLTGAESSRQRPEINNKPDTPTDSDDEVSPQPATPKKGIKGIIKRTFLEIKRTITRTVKRKLR